MAPADWWLIGARLLGVYLLVLAGVYATGAVAMLGVPLPHGSHPFVIAGAPLIQGLIAGGAGLWLFRRSAVPPVANVAPARGAAFVHALQLLGIFFLVSGAPELLSVLIARYFDFAGVNWQSRSSQVASGVVEGVAGALLTFTPVPVARKLTEIAERGPNKPLQPTSGADGQVGSTGP